MAAPTTRHSIEFYGLGQSGYTAGRVEGDPSLSLSLDGRNVSYPRGIDEHVLELAADERFLGRGGPPWAPEATESGKEGRTTDRFKKG